MELFNKYKNRNFAFITNYINNCINDDSLSVSEEELEKQLSGASQNTFSEFIMALMNAYAPSESFNASLLYRNNGVMQPLRQIAVPVRATIAEKAWLYYTLQNSKSDLFLEEKTKVKLISALEEDIDSIRFPIKADYIDTRYPSPDNRMEITKELINCFMTIVEAIKDHKSILVTNNSFSGKTYENQEVYPYKLEYSPQFDSFSLSCYPIKEQRPIKMNLKNISSVAIASTIENYQEFIREFEKKLADTKEKLPVTIEIKNEAEAYDRCAYLFSAFDTYCYEKGNDMLIMNIYYYRFQKEEIIRNILLLGRFVKVISPQDVTDEVVSSIKKAYQQYL